MAKKSSSQKPAPKPCPPKPAWQSQIAAQSIAAAEARLRGQTA